MLAEQGPDDMNIAVCPLRAILLPPPLQTVVHVFNQVRGLPSFWLLSPQAMLGIGSIS